LTLFSTLRPHWAPCDTTWSLSRSFSLAHGLFAFAKYWVHLRKHKSFWMFTRWNARFLGFESALGCALGRTIGGVHCSPLRLSVCSCGRSRGYWVPACAHESLRDSGPWVHLGEWRCLPYDIVGEFLFYSSCYLAMWV